MVIALGLLCVLAVVIVSYYNKFVSLDNSAKEAFSGMDVQLKRRYDLIPNLVETVKGYASHEQETFTKVVEARRFAMGLESTDAAKKAMAENGLTACLKTLFAIAENYPELKANQNFLELQSSLSQIEEAIQNARRFYNAVVKDYNILCETFPSVIVAKIFNFAKKSYFDISQSERENVQVSFK